MSITETIKVLEKRAEFLAARIANNPDKDLSFDKAEHSALRRALLVLVDHHGERKVSRNEPMVPLLQRGA